MNSKTRPVNKFVGNPCLLSTTRLSGTWQHQPQKEGRGYDCRCPELSSENNIDPNQGWQTLCTSWTKQPHRFCFECCWKWLSLKNGFDLIVFWYFPLSDKKCHNKEICDRFMKAWILFDGKWIPTKSDQFYLNFQRFRFQTLKILALHDPYSISWLDWCLFWTKVYLFLFCCFYRFVSF